MKKSQPNLELMDISSSEKKHSSSEKFYDEYRGIIVKWKSIALEIIVCSHFSLSVHISCCVLWTHCKFLQAAACS
jgi:hypothetical protein